MLCAIGWMRGGRSSPSSATLTFIHQLFHLKAVNFSLANQNDGAQG